jgi:hypothetical protein
MAHLGVPQPDDKGEQDVLLKACSSIRHIVYLLHKAGITQAEYLRASDTHWKHLEDEHLIDFPMRIVRDRRRDNDEISVRFLEWSKERLLRLSRDMLAQRPNSALLVSAETSCVGNLPSEFWKCTGFTAICHPLRAFLEDPIHGASALRAPRGIESR